MRVKEMPSPECECKKLNQLEWNGYCGVHGRIVTPIYLVFLNDAGSCPPTDNLLVYDSYNKDLNTEVWYRNLTDANKFAVIYKDESNSWNFSKLNKQITL